MASIEAHIRSHHSAAQAALVRRLGNLDLAEDAMQDAILAALKSWPQTGVPEHPAAWLVTAGYHKFVDDVRRSSRFVSLSEPITVEEGRDDCNPDEELIIDNDVLRLSFMCAHPALATENQLAITLKFVMGFSTDEIARALMVSGKTIEKRLTRAKRKIADSGIRFEFPLPARLNARLEAVRLSLYLIFNAGYFGSEGELINQLLCNQAITLTRSLCRTFPDGENFGLLALMLFQHSRWQARVDEQGRLVTLDKQDRRLWLTSNIAEADVLLQKSLRQGAPGNFQLQAAIAGVHSVSESAEHTDWAEIVSLYRLLLQVRPSPVVHLNYAAALLMVGDLSRAVGVFELIAEDLADYSPFYAAKARLYDLQGKPEEMRDALLSASRLSSSIQERGHYERQLEIALTTSRSA